MRITVDKITKFPKFKLAMATVCKEAWKICSHDHDMTCDMFLKRSPTDRISSFK